jgi:RNA polymerase sigma factor (sigma-70 family)
MATTSTNRVLRHIREMVAAENIGKLSDQLLLERFTHHHEEEAFGELVRRHGPLVLGVCRRLLGNLHDAEDVFQATFLALAQKGHLIRSDSVGSWLYQVAYRTALRVRARTSNRASHERQAALHQPSDPLAEVTGRELLSVLDEELQHLPDTYRTPLLLCYLQGLTQDEAARQLGWSLRTLRRRLEQGRQRLRLRLSRRGLTLSAALVAAGVGQGTAVGALPRLLAASTIGLVAQAVQGPAALPESLAPLVDGALKALLVLPPKAVTLGGLLLAGVLALGIGALTRLDGARPQPEDTTGLHSPLPEVKESAKNDAGKPAEKKGLIVNGRVLDPSGKPLAKAEVALVGRPKPPLRGDFRKTWNQVLTQSQTDGEGRFRLSSPKSSPDTFYEVFVLARASGFAPGRNDLKGEAEKGEVEVRLSQEQAVRGRLIDLQGQPAAGVKVHVLDFSAAVAPNSLPKKDVPRASFLEMPQGLRLWPAAATTDAQGRFVLHGLRPDWNITIEVRDKDKARQEITLKAQDKGKSEEVPLVLSPVRILEGAVTYEDTGKPVANTRLVTIAADMQKLYVQYSYWKTDAKGRFRALPHEANYFMLTAYPPPGEPYLPSWKEVGWPEAGVAKLEVPLKLVRGIVVRGTVTETASGKPVAGAYFQYEQQPDNNPFLRRDVRGRGLGEPRYVRSGADGKFEAVVLPGPGHLLVNGPALEYLHTEAISTNVLGSDVRPKRRLYPDALIKLNYKPGAGPQEIAVKLRRGVTVAGKVLTPEGEPVAKAQMVCQSYVPYGHGFLNIKPLPVDHGKFELPGCDPDRALPVYFLDAANQLGAMVKLSGKDVGAKAPTVKLQPCGSVTARFLDAEGKPLANRDTFLELALNDGVSFWDSLTADKVVADEVSMRGLDAKRYQKLQTDAQGRVTLPTLIPGARFVLAVRLPGSRTVKVRDDLTVEAGKTLDLKDITVKAPQ